MQTPGFGEDLFRTIQRMHLPRQDISLFQPLLHAVDIFRFHRGALLRNTRRLIQRYDRFVPVKIIQQTYRMFRKIRQIPVQFCTAPKLLQFFCQRIHRTFQPKCLFCFPLFTQARRSRLFLLPQTANAIPHLRFS